MAADPSGNLFFLDGDTVRKIDTKGIITTIAGDGTQGSMATAGQVTRLTTSPSDSPSRTATCMSPMPAMTGSE